MPNTHSPSNDKHDSSSSDNGSASVELNERSSKGSDVSGGNALNQFFNSPKSIGILIGAAVVLVLVVLGLWTAFSGGASGEEGGSSAGSDDRSGIFKELPGSGGRDQASGISGLSGRSCDTATRRPIGVMLAADPVNRPVSGFSEADMVFELPVLVSNVTRLMALYQCGTPEEVGSIRSARHDYLFLAKGSDAILAHWGGSYHALNRIKVGEFNTINALSNPHNAFFRKQSIPRPYNGFSSYERLWEALQKLGYRTETEFEGYDFTEGIKADERPAGGTLSIAWPGQYRVRYEYDPEDNRYQRYWAGVKQNDAEDGEPVRPSSVVIMRAGQSYAQGPGGYNDVDIEGEGKLEVYQNGKKITGTWRKDTRYKDDPVHFLDENGDPIKLVAGQVWVMAVEPRIDVDWSVQEVESEEGQAPA